MTVQPQVVEACFCRGCGYALAGLDAHRCPECGRAFDPTDRRTFDRDRDRHSARRKLRRLAALLIVLELVVVVPLSVVRWQWRSEQQAIAYIASRGGTVGQSPIGPAWLRLILRKHAYVLDRVDSVDFRLTTTSSPLDATRLYPLRRLRFLRMGSDLRSADLAGLGHFPLLEHLDLSIASLDDDALVHLHDLPRLTRLELGRDLTGGGLVYLRNVPSLRNIGFAQFVRHELWLRALRDLPNLEELRYSYFYYRLTSAQLRTALEGATVPNYLFNSAPPRPVSRMLHELAVEKDPLKRVELVRQLGGARDERAVDELARLAADANENAAVRADCVWALGDIGGPAACRQLVDLFDADFAHLRAPRQKFGADEYHTYIIQSLSRASGMQFGTDVNAWRRWAAMLPQANSVP